MMKWQTLALQVIMLFQICYILSLGQSEQGAIYLSQDEGDVQKMNNARTLSSNLS